MTTPTVSTSTSSNTTNSVTMNMVPIPENLLQQMLQLVSATRTTAAAASDTQFQVMADLSKSIGDFDGGDLNDQAAKFWITNVNAMAELHRWPDSFKLQTARMHMIGPAKDWILSRLDQITTWTDFEAAFRKTFVRETSYSQKFNAMQECVQTKGESVIAYYLKKIRLCQALNLDFSDVKEQVLLGVWSKELAQTMIVKSHLDVDDLFADIQSYERVSQGRIERIGRNRNENRQQGNHHRLGLHRRDQNNTSYHTIQHHPSQPQGQHQNTVPPNKPERYNFLNHRKTYSNNTNFPNNFKCFRCAESGHLARDCPKYKVCCSKCRVEGHTARHCTKDQLGTQQRVPTAENNPIRETLHLITKPTPTKASLLHEKEIVINGNNKLMCLIDSGSSLNIMRESTAKRMGLKWTPDDTVVCGFGVNANTKVLGKTTARINIDKATIDDLTIYVVPDEAHPRECLFGRQLCESTDIAFVKYKDKLEYYNITEFPFANSPEFTDSQASCELTVNGTVELPARHVTMVDAHLADRQVQVPVRNDTIQSHTLKDGHVLARSVDQAGKNNTLVPYSRPITYNDIERPSLLNEYEQNELIDLINDYRTCFATSMEELGCTTLGEMDIQLKEGSTPTSAKPYHTSREDRNTIKNHIQKWREHGIVEDTTSPFASPVILVKKQNGDSRMVVDYRRVNALTVKQPYPIPNIDQLIEKFTGSTMFTSLDLAHGYLQIPLSAEARKASAFITPDETGQFTRMYFGLMNAPYEFAKIMNQAMGKLKNNVVINYFDNYYIAARNWKEMRERLELVFKALMNANLTLRPSKCQFAAKQIEFLGFELSAQGIKPGIRKMEAIRSYREPVNVHEVRRFVGLVSYFRRFIPKFATIIRPITDLTKKTKEFEWNLLQKESFNKLKNLITEQPVIQIFDPTKYTELHTDASAAGLAGMLFQRDEIKQLKLVYCVSKKNSETERHYHSSKLELMAIVWSLDRLRHLILGIHVTIITDCQALAHMNTLKARNPQLIRWFDLLQEYDIEIKHRPGDKMQHIDALSRIPCEESTDTMEEIINNRLEILPAMTEEEYVAGMQYGDHDIKQIITELKSDSPRRQTIDNYKLYNNLLYRKVHINKHQILRWMVPKSMRKGIVIKYHDLSGHFALDRTVSKISEKYYFPGMRRYVRVHISCCPQCAITKVPKGRKPGMLHPITPGSRPFETINIDHLGPFVTSTKGMTHLLVIVCNLTKFIKLYPVKNTKAITTINKLKKFALTYGLPRRIISDRGTAFTAESFQQYCNENGIQHHLVSVRHPRANGQVERNNATIIDILMTRCLNENQWDQEIEEIEFHMNSTSNKTTGLTPFMALMGYTPTLHDGLISSMTEMNQTRQNPSELWEDIQKKISMAHDGWKTRHDAHRSQMKYDVGEIVMLRQPNVSTGKSTKLQRRYRGPMIITSVKPGDTYGLADLNHGPRTLYATTAHVSIIKPFNKHNIEEEDDNMSDEEVAEDTIKETTPMLSKLNHQRPTRQHRKPKRLTDYEI